MKNIYIIFSLTLLSLFASHSAQATVDTVTVQNNPSHFLPVTLYAVVGDTIHWTWITGNHIVGAVNASDIPNGAPNWNGTIDAGHHTFDYVVTVAGNYHYECHPAFPHGEPGYIVVSAPTGVSSIAPNSVSLVYPNPFTNKITIETPAAETIVVYNKMGEKIKSVALNAQTKIEIDMTEFTAGIYFYAVIKEGVAVETRKMIKN